jgi:hypothetical protein
MNSGPSTKANAAYASQTCESCGATFGCGAKAQSCWCNDAKLSDEVLKDLQSRFNKCLCQDCLLDLERNTIKLP